MFSVACCFLGLVFAQSFPQPEPARDVTVPGIPGIVAGGAKWEIAWQGTDNADGIVGTSDGGLLFAQEQPSRISKIDRKGNVSAFLDDTHGAGAIAIDSKGRILVAERTCTDPGGHPADCKEPTAIAMLFPERKILADNAGGKSLGRLNDLVAAKSGAVYFNGGGTFFMNPAGKVMGIGENIRTNGIMLSRDEKTLYVTNGGAIVAFDVQKDGSVANQREFGKLEGGGNGDGMAIDSAGRLYITSPSGVQVLSAEGKYLGVIPTPRSAISVTFSGSNKKTLFVVGSGAVDAAGKEIRTPAGVRNNAKTIYRISVLAQGFKGRPK
jgi:gluconolactonase